MTFDSGKLGVLFSQNNKHHRASISTKKESKVEDTFRTMQGTNISERRGIPIEVRPSLIKSLTTDSRISIKKPSE